MVHYLNISYTHVYKTKYLWTYTGTYILDMNEYLRGGEGWEGWEYSTFDDVDDGDVDDDDLNIYSKH